MYIDSSSYTQGGKTYTRHLLRESYREGGKVKNRTHANLSHCSEEEIAAIKLALKYKSNLALLGSIEDVQVEAGSRVGAVFCLHMIAQRIGLTKVLGRGQEGLLALWQIYARLIDQGSSLSAVRLAESHAACDILGLESFNEDHLYDNLAWLCERQESIEKALFRLKYGESVPQLFLYDVTSSYLEGMHNILAAFGYNRDGKKGKKQLVIGLLTGPDGDPVAVRVFVGNTSDTASVAEQVRALAERFGVEEVVLVGDRGMLKKKQTDLLHEHDFHYITAITKPQIRTLLEKDVIQLGLFDDQLCEVQDGPVRYVLRRNPQRESEIANSRDDRIKALNRFVQEQTQYLLTHSRAKVDIAHNKILSRANRYGLKDIVEVVISERTISLIIDEEAKQKASVLDGCYVIRTDVPRSQLSTEAVHDRYKDLAQVERAFRTWKTGHLELRPVFVQKEASTRGHVFVVMLAYLLERELDRSWRHIEMTVPEAIDELGSLRGTVIRLGQGSCQKIPTPTGRTKELLDAADIRLPEVIQLRGIKVVTRRKLVPGRKPQ
jgi:transposase